MSYYIFNKFLYDFYLLFVTHMIDWKLFVISYDDLLICKNVSYTI